jgi:prophage DNA circulation protein
MFKADALEAQVILNATLDSLLSWAPTQGRPGSDLRTAVNDVKAYALELLQYDLIDIPLINCFDLAYTSGINLYQIETVRQTAAAQSAVSVGAIMTKDTLIELAFATEGYVISNMTFVSRDDVDQLKISVNAAFADMEEEIADEMDSMTWRAILKLHAAISLYLVQTARPLPRMVNYHFNLTLPSVVMAHRLYADASRADELRNENKVVHPAFCPHDGRALSV